MERNAWRVAHDIALLIDDAPVLSDYIRAFLIEWRRRPFFFITGPSFMITWRHLKVQKNVFKYIYFAKICYYINDHYDVGELFMGFVKVTCKVKKRATVRFM